MFALWFQPTALADFGRLFPRQSAIGRAANHDLGPHRLNLVLITGKDRVCKVDVPSGKGLHDSGAMFIF